MARNSKLFVIEGKSEDIEVIECGCESCLEEFLMYLGDAEHVEYCPYCGNKVDLEFVEKYSDIQWGNIIAERDVHTKVTVSSLPQCDICNTEKAKYDAKTTSGPWANMCEGCFKKHGIKLGLGFGQELVLKEGKKW